MKITFTDQDKNSFFVIHDDGNHTIISNPPGTKEDEKLIREYGGLYEVERTWVELSREQTEYDARFEKFMNNEVRHAESLTINGIIEENLSKADVMKIKMSMFKHRAVKGCKDKDMVTKLRQADNIIDIVMYFGMIRNGIKAGR